MDELAVEIIDQPLDRRLPPLQEALTAAPSKPLSAKSSQARSPPSLRP